MSEPELEKISSPSLKKREYAISVRGQQGVQQAVLDSRDLKGDRKDPIIHNRYENLDILSNEYIFYQIIGQGSFGVVTKVESKTTNKIFACKMIKKKGTPSHYEQLMREVDVMKVVSHPNIVQLKQVYESPKKIALIMEFCGGGELVQTIRKRGVLKQSEIQSIIKQLVDVVSYLHRHGIVHRDIKPENILLDDSDPKALYAIKVSDFGLACFADAMNRVEHVAGTPMYMAPEVIHNLGYNHQCDIWSIGVMLYLLLCNYDKNAEQMLSEMIRNNKIEYPQRFWHNIDPRAKHLCQMILKFDPAKRISAGEILSHPWLKNEALGKNNNDNVLDLMKSYNAERRFKKAFNFVMAAIRFKSSIPRLKTAILAPTITSIDGLNKVGTKTSSNGSKDSIGSKGSLLKDLPKNANDKKKKKP